MKVLVEGGRGDALFRVNRISAIHVIPLNPFCLLTLWKSLTDILDLEV